MPPKKRVLSFEEEGDSDDGDIGSLGSSALKASRNSDFGKLSDVTDARFRKEVQEKDKRRKGIATSTISFDVGSGGGSIVVKAAGGSKLDGVAIGHAASVGGRTSMEDAIAERPDQGGKVGAMAGVYDGHNGPQAASFLQQRLLPEMEARLAEVPPESSKEAFRSAVVTAFKSVENQLLSLAGSSHFNDGSTACVVCVVGSGSSLLCANCGDTRAILCGTGTRAERLSVDHKVEGEERARVEAAGGNVIHKGCWRISLGGYGIAVSRSFGDNEFKHGHKLPKGEALVLCTPHVSLTNLQASEHTFVVIASDGLWDVVTDTRAADIVDRTRGNDAWTDEVAKLCAKALVDAAITAKTQDNVAVIVLGFKWPKTAAK